VPKTGHGSPQNHEEGAIQEETPLTLSGLGAALSGNVELLAHRWLIDIKLRAVEVGAITRIEKLNKRASACWSSLEEKVDGLVGDFWATSHLFSVAREGDN
jgi:hypothetical protein